MRPEYELVFYVLAAVVGVLAVVEPRVPALTRLRVNLLALALLIVLAVPLINAIKSGWNVDII